MPSIELYHRNVGRHDAGAQFNRIAAAKVGDGILPVARSEDIDIITKTAFEPVITGIPAHDVGIELGAAVAVPYEQIVAASANQDVGPFAADERVVALATREPVLAESSVEIIVVRAARQLVVPGISERGIVPGIPKNRIIQRAAFAVRIAVAIVDDFRSLEADRQAFEILRHELSAVDILQSQQFAERAVCELASEQRVRAVLHQPQAFFDEGIGARGNDADDITAGSGCEIRNYIRNMVYPGILAGHTDVKVATFATNVDVHRVICTDIEEDIVAIASGNGIRPFPTG